MPRDRQTQRTRRALIAAADELFAEGGVPTVAAVAERADVARATAYRYFPTQEALLLETTFLGDSDALRDIPGLAAAIEDPAERMAEAVRTGARAGGGAPPRCWSRSRTRFPRRPAPAWPAPSPCSSGSTRSSRSRTTAT